MEHMKSKNKRLSWLASFLIITILASMLSACTLNSGNEEEEKRLLRIGVIEGYRYVEENIRSEYTDTFQMLHPNIDIEIVSAIDYEARQYTDNGDEDPDPFEEMEKLMTGDNPPDVVFIDYNQLPNFVNQNLLKPLDPYIADDEFDIEGYVPAVIEGLKLMGNNQLYGLAPQFISFALIYNREIFEERGVDFPKDNMTWDDLFTLARQVAHGEGTDRVYGFKFSKSMYSSMLEDTLVYTAPIKLQYMDEDQEHMLVDSEQWRDVMKEVIALYDENIIPMEDQLYEIRNELREIMPDDLARDMFLNGRLAMTVVNYADLSDIITANNYAANIEGFDGVQWDVVTLPVHPEYPNIGSYILTEGLMAINANATNPDDAWELIKFFNGEDWAKLRSRSSELLMSREDYIKPIDGLDYNIQAFTQLTPAEFPNLKYYMYDNELFWHIKDIGEQFIRRVINQEMELDEALSLWQTQGDALLKAVKENPDADIWDIYNEIMMQSVEETGEIIY